MHTAIRNCLAVKCSSGQDALDTFDADRTTNSLCISLVPQCMKGICSYSTAAPDVRKLTAEQRHKLLDARDRGAYGR